MKSIGYHEALESYAKYAKLNGLSKEAQIEIIEKEIEEIFEWAYKNE